ncbi:MAG: GMP synthase (glutamine-hydrolyzing) [Chlamydiales bacterium]|jgi:GMP synthase (glutamine-hydrolysing)
MPNSFNSRMTFLMLFLCCNIIVTVTAEGMPRKAIVIENDVICPMARLKPLLEDREFQVETIQAWKNGLSLLDSDAADLLIILGGSQSVYETKKHPYFYEEFSIIQRRVQQKQATIGICLGAQMISKSLGGEVNHGSEAEVGWITLRATKSTYKSPLQNLTANKTKVFSWHHDGFTLPENAVLMAETKLYPQAFAIENHTLALQFHPEADLETARGWYSLAVIDNVDTQEVDKESIVEFKRNEEEIMFFWNSCLDWLGFHDGDSILLSVAVS